MNSWTTYQKYGIKLNSPYQAGCIFSRTIIYLPPFLKIIFNPEVNYAFYGFIRWIGENIWFLGKNQLNFG